jgi:TonB-dependent starch-binding outer membrane protein SusC
MKKVYFTKIIMMLFMIAFFDLKAQTTTLTGKVNDEFGEPLIGANVTQKGTTNGTLVDSKGNFSLKVAQGQKVIVVSFIGYVTQEVPFEGKTEISVALKEDAKSLDEVVVVGYGVKNRRDILGSVGSIKEQQISPDYASKHI